MKLETLNKICEMLLTEHPDAYLEVKENKIVIYKTIMTICLDKPEENYLNKEDNYTIKQGGTRG